MVEEEKMQAKLKKGEQLLFYGFNARMIPDEVHSKPVYRRLVPRTEDEMVILEKMKKKLEAINKKRKSRSLDPTKARIEEESKVADNDARSEVPDNLS